MTWQKMTILVWSLLMPTFFPGNWNLFRPTVKMWKAPKTLHATFKLEEVRSCRNQYISFNIKPLKEELQYWNFVVDFQTQTSIKHCCKEQICWTRMTEKVQHQSLYSSQMDSQPQVVTNDTCTKMCTNTSGLNDFSQWVYCDFNKERSFERPEHGLMKNSLRFGNKTLTN